MDEPEEEGFAVELRIGDADRHAVVERLSHAMAEGRLDPDEFAARSRAAYQAKVASDLAPLTVDLPPVDLPAPVPSTRPAQTTPVRPAPQARARRWVIAIFGDRSLSGRWDPRDQTVAMSVFGDQRIDFTEVTSTHADIVSISVFGDLKVTVPPGTRVEVDGLTVFGDVRDRREALPDAGGLVVRVRRFALFGDLRIGAAS